MKTYYDSDNGLGKDSVDRLRSELGLQYQAGSIKNYSEGKIIHKEISSPTVNSQKLFPTKTQTIFLYATDGQFRDGIQWKGYIRGLVSQGTPFVDHTFNINTINETVALKKRFHHPSYEDITKSFPTNALLNYNIVNTKYSSPLVDDMGTLRNEFDDDSFYGSTSAKGNHRHTTRVMNNYVKRSSLAVISEGQIINKNKNIYMINNQNVSRAASPSDIWPFYVNISANAGPLYDNQLLEIFQNNNYEKNILQLINGNVLHQNLFFVDSTIKAYDMVDIFNNIDFMNFSEKENELFLLNSDDSLNNFSNRFMNQIRTIKVMERINNLIQNNLRDYEETINFNSCKKYNIAYKIEKYLDRNSGQPIQTYYIKNDQNSLNFIDTQLKFGRKYHYRVYNVMCVLGSSYKYDNLIISSTDDEEYPSYTSNLDTSYYHRARVDVEIFPSMKFLEIPIHNSTKVLYDDAPPVPYVDFSLSSKGINIHFEPKGYDQLMDYEFNPIHEEEEIIKEKIELASSGYSKESRSFKYFNGDYVVYRLSAKPTKIRDFYDAKIAKVGLEVSNMLINKSGDGNYIIEKTKSLSALYEDRISTNKKYYYLFRAVSYHDTPSNPTPIYEVEIMETASDRLLKINTFEFEKVEKFTRKKKFKRLMKIDPNWMQLEIQNFGVNNIEDAMKNLGGYEKDLFTKLGNKFKIRLTSVHTGKKIDLNVNFKIIKRTN